MRNFAVFIAALCAACADDARVVTLIETGGSRPTVAVTSAGALLVAWVDSGNVLLARSADAESFTRVRVNDIDGDAAAHDQAPAQVAAAPDGSIYAVWQNNTRVEGRHFPYSDVRFARSLDGGLTFEPATTVNDDANGPPAAHTFHSIAVAPDGVIYIAWIDGRASAGHEGHHGRPGPQIRVSRSTDGGKSFAPSVLVAEEACPCCRTSLAVTRNGEVALAWRAVRDVDLRDIVVARSTDGGATFSAPNTVHEDGWRLDGCPHAGPSIAYDGAGNLHAAWYTGREDSPGIYHAVSTDGGGSFGAATPLITGDGIPASLVSLAADEEGAVWAAWDDRRARPARVKVARISDGKIARAAVTPGRTPSLAIAAGKRVLAVLDEKAVRVRTWKR
jgi:hypothetical protein